jgi:probable O-glycosylation ligase (exosortase A-associated)
MQDFPVYRTLFAATLLGALFTRDRALPPRDWRVAALVLLWLGVFAATQHAAFPVNAWPRFVEFSGSLGATVLVLLLINTRQKLFLLLATIALAFAVVTIKGGYWAVIHGFADRVYGPPGSQYHDNNHFAVAAVMTIPLLLLWLRNSHGLWLKGVLAVVIGLSVLAVLSSWSRGGLLAFGVALLLLLLDSRRALWSAVPLLGVLLVAVLFFPDQWFDRMHSIASYETDSSAQSRIEVWKRAIGFVQLYPVLGTGFESFQFGKPSFDWHNVYIELSVEQGLLNFVFWAALVGGVLLGLSQLIRNAAPGPEAPWIRDYSVALRASLAAYCVGGMFLGIAYWGLLYLLLGAAIVLLSLAAQAGIAPRSS